MVGLALILRLRISEPRTSANGRDPEITGIQLHEWLTLFDVPIISLQCKRLRELCLRARVRSNLCLEEFPLHSAMAGRWC
jgi:hypothetical protein